MGGPRRRWGSSGGGRPVGTGRNSAILHGSTSGKTSGVPAVLATKQVSVRSGLAQWQQIGFRCSSEGPVGSETDFGAVTSRQKAPIARSEAEFRCKNNRINSRCELLRPQTLWERDKRHPQNVLTAPKLVSLPAHSAKLLRNPFYCQKGPKAILVTRLAPPHKAGSRPGRLPTRKTVGPASCADAGVCPRLCRPQQGAAEPASRAGTSACRNYGARTNRSGQTRRIPEPVLVVQPPLTYPSAGAQLALEGVSSICHPSVGGAVQFAKPQDDCPNVREVSEQVWQSSRRTIRDKFAACAVRVARPETLGWRYNACNRPTPAPHTWRSPCQRRSSQNRSTA